MSEPETPTTPYMANPLNSDQTVAQDIWLDWDEEENDNDNDTDTHRATSPAVRVKEEPVSPGQSPVPPELSETPAPAELEQSLVPLQPTEEVFTATVKAEALSPPPSPFPSEPEQEPEEEEEPEPGTFDAITGPMKDEDDNDMHEDFQFNGEEANYEEEEYEYNCHFCFAGFSRKQQLREHYKKGHNTSTSLSCDVCLVNFKHKRDYSRHMRLHITEKHLKCDRCLIKYQTERHLIDHVLDRHFDDCKFICEYCDAPFTYKEDLLQHKHTEHTALQDGYRCEHCNVGFKRKKILELHVQCVHVDTFKCQICQLVMSDRAQYRKHARVHSRTDSRKAFCDACGSRFKFERTLKVHRLVCLGRRLNMMRFSKHPNELLAASKSQAEGEEKEVVDTRPHSNIAKVIFDGNKLVTLHQAQQRHRGVSDVLVGGVSVTEGAPSDVVAALTPEEFPGRWVNIEIYKPDDPNSTADKSSSPAEKSTDTTQKTSASRNATSAVSSATADQSSTSSATDAVTNGTTCPETSNADCDNAVQERTASAMSNNSQASDTAGDSSQGNDSEARSSSKPPPKSEPTVLLSTEQIRQESRRKKPVVEEPDVEPMTVAEILEVVESCSPTVNGPLKRGLNSDECPIENIYKMKELPEKCIKALKAHGLPRIIKKPRLMSETIHEAMELRSTGSREPNAFTCKTCNAEFVFKYDLIRHERTGHVTALKCTQCSATFLKKEELAQHTLETHFRRTGPRLGKTPSIFTNMMAERSSPRLRPRGGGIGGIADSGPDQIFSCQNCDANFAYEAELNHHMRVHGTDYKCNACKASFREKSELAKHMLANHF